MPSEERSVRSPTSSQPLDPAADRATEPGDTPVRDTAAQPTTAVGRDARARAMPAQPPSAPGRATQVSAPWSEAAARAPLAEAEAVHVEPESPELRTCPSP